MWICFKPTSHEQSWHHISGCSLRWQNRTCSLLLVLWFSSLEEKKKKKWRVAVWSVCLIYMRNKNQSLSLSHPFIRPASTTLLMILCIIQKQFGRLHFREIVVLTHNQTTSDVCQYLKNVLKHPKCPMCADLTWLSRIFHHDHCDEIE